MTRSFVERLSEMVAQVAESEAPGAAMRAMTQKRAPRAVSARRVAVGSVLPVNRAPRIAVVGAGLAGLTCAYRLKQAGCHAAVYEASNRVGGRCWTIRGAFDQEQIAEHGGELIDSHHQAIIQLALELGLGLDSLDRAHKEGAGELYYIDGQQYASADVISDLRSIWPKLQADVTAAAYPTLYDTYTARGWELDHMSISDWIAETVPGGLSHRLGKLLALAYTIYYGADADEQSALNLLYMMGHRNQGLLRMYGPSDGKYHVNGGNDQIPRRLADELQGQVQMEHALTAIRREDDDTYRLTFDIPGGPSCDVTADHVVLAIPFTILRSRVDFSQAGFQPLKETAIREMGMGTNCKLHLQFTDRHWEDFRCIGETYSDTGYQQTWEVTRGQPGTAGVLVNYAGGTYGLSFGDGEAELGARFLGQLEPVLPGITAKYNARMTVDYWPGNAWTRGSYSYWKVGQRTQFAGVEAEREGSVHFCGEHTSVEFQGFMNGAVETGERAAREILRDLQVPAR